MNTITSTETINERQTSDFDFIVDQVALQTPDGKPTRFVGNRRIDTGEILGIVTERYEVLQNAPLFGAFENVLSNKGFGNFKRKIVSTHSGARVRAVYDFPNTGFTLKNKDDLTFRLKVQNSFDGSLRASIQVGMVRLICTNGLAAPVAAVGMTRKHTTGLDGELVEQAFIKSVDAFQNAAPLFNQMIDLRVSQNDGRNILLNFEKSKVMSERMREGIESVWEGPSYKEDSDRNLFNLYNAVTQHLTHSVEGKRFELAERINTSVLNAFTKAAKRGSVDYLASAIANSSLN